tara:strand:+ start:6287 stop:6910 length:624 start_codon:yes stop_codon:yes gene_type:complete
MGNEIEKMEQVLGSLVDKFDNLSDDATLEELSTLTNQITDATTQFNENQIKESEQPMGDNLKVRLGYSNVSNNVEPFYSYKTDSGFDLRSNEDITINPKETEMISTGISFDIPKGFEIQVRSRSGLAVKNNVFVLNSPGTVDQGYIGEVKIILSNFGNLPFEVKKGERIAQACLCPVVTGEYVDLIKTNNNKSTDRGDGGFGSTGTN